MSAANVFLQLLADDAPSSAFYDVPLRASGSQQALDKDVALALRVSERLSEQKRRHAEFEALYTTAGDLTSIRNVDEVLSAIIRRARDLLAADVSYMTLNDGHNGPTRVRASVGTTSPAFDRIRLMPGSGLGGLVAESCTPIVTSRYIDDPRIPHRADVDDIVTGERIVAMLGVPLKTTSGVLGVLFVAHRSERNFTADEVSLLSYLAAHAAIAIENARLFEESQELTRIVEASIREHEQLTELVLRGDSAADVASSLQDVLGGAIVVVDADERVVASCSTDEPAVPGLVERLLEHSRLGDSGLHAGLSTFELTNGDGGSAAVAYALPIAARDQSLGRLYAVREQAAEDWQLRLLERAGVITALVFLNEDLVARAEQQARGDLMNDLLDASARERDAVVRRARAVGLDVAAPHVVLVADSDGSSGSMVRCSSALVRQLGGVVGERSQQLVAVLPARHQRSASDVFDHLSQSRVVTGGLSEAVTGIEDLARAYDQARRCVRVQLRLGREGQLADMTSLGVFGLVAGELSESAVHDLMHARLHALEEFDAHHDSHLVETLDAYYTHKRKLASAAESLHVHVNTLYRRLERVAELLGPEWDSPDESLQTALALRLRQLSRGGRPTRGMPGP